MGGLDFSFFNEYFPVFLEGAQWTLIISAITVVLGVLLGTLLCFMKRSKISIFKIRILNVISSIYIEIVRGTPLLLQIYIVYFGLPSFGIQLGVLSSCIIAIALNSAAYVSEIIRAGIDAVDKGQLEAARSLGMTESMAMRLIILPQAIKNILPAIGNEFVSIIKESSMASTIGVAELMFSAKIVTGATYKGFEPLIVIAVFYFIMTFTLGRAMSYVERRLNKS